MKTHLYFLKALERRPNLKVEWCLRVITSPERKEIQDDGRVRYWGHIPEYGNRVLRVVTLEDGETLFNAFFDRGFRP